MLGVFVPLDYSTALELNGPPCLSYSLTMFPLRQYYKEELFIYPFIHSSNYLSAYLFIYLFIYVPFILAIDVSVIRVMLQSTT